MRRPMIVAPMLLALAAGSARAEHAKIELTVTSARGEQTAFVDQTPPPSGKNPRPVLKARAGDVISYHWIFQNIYPNKTIENVVVHFFVAREAKVGQKDLPDMSGDVPLEAAFDMDFKPGAKAGQHGRFKIDTPGVYLVRVESRQTQSDHEHFAAIDLVIEPGGEGP